MMMLVKFRGTDVDHVFANDASTLQGLQVLNHQGCKHKKPKRWLTLLIRCIYCGYGRYVCDTMPRHVPNYTIITTLQLPSILCTQIIIVLKSFFVTCDLCRSLVAVSSTSFLVNSLHSIQTIIGQSYKRDSLMFVVIVKIVIISTTTNTDGSFFYIYLHFRSKKIVVCPCPRLPFINVAPKFAIGCPKDFLHSVFNLDREG